MVTGFSVFSGFVGKWTFPTNFPTFWCVGSRCLYLLRSAAYRYLCIISVGIVCEIGDYALRACGAYDIVIAVIGVSLLCPCGQLYFCKVVVGIFVCGRFLLKVCYACYVAVCVVHIAVAELFLAWKPPALCLIGMNAMGYGIHINGFRSFKRMIFQYKWHKWYGFAV